MRLFIYPLSTLLLFLSFGCSDDEMADESPEYSAKIRATIGSIGDSTVNVVFSQAFCSDGIFEQTLSGGSSGIYYHSEFGNQFFGTSAALPLSFTTVALGELADPSVASSLNVGSNLRIAQDYLAGLAQEDLYLSLKVVYNGITYQTFSWNRLNNNITHLDGNRDDGLIIRLNDTDVCGDNLLVIESDWTYNGYAYNLESPFDSIYLENVRIQMLNGAY